MSGPHNGAAANRPRKRLHRLHCARVRQGLSLRSAARRLNQTVTQTRAEEDETADLPISTLLRWREALDVPVAELLVENDDPLSEPILRRAHMLKMMRTARTILEIGGSDQLQRLTERLVDQLVQMMPELKTISAWPSTGQRRTLDEFGRIAQNPLPDHLLMDTGDGTVR